jgi:uncharacterized RDD family membrane protein YckC
MVYENPAAATPPYSNWLQRVGAWLIDYMIIVVVYLVGFAIVAATRSGALIFLFILAALGVAIYNRWYLMGSTGQSWGKKALNIKLVSEATGEPIGPVMAFVRDIAHIVDGIICDIGYLFPLWDAKRQTLADKIMSTVVVDV